MKKYNSVEIEVINISNEDIIITSNGNYYEDNLGNGGSSGEGNENWSDS